MTARLLDTFDDEGFENDPLSKAFAPAERPSVVTGQNPESTTPAPATPKVPDKYVGKTVDQLIAELENSQSMIGRQSAEVGAARARADAAEAAAAQARALVDKALRFNQGTGQTDDEETALTGDKLLARPTEEVTRVVRSETAELRDEVASLKALSAADRFAGAHPTAKADMNDPAFVAWVQKSKVRMKTAAKVFSPNVAPDWEAADDLWNDYDAERTPTQGATAPVTTFETPNQPVQPQAPTFVKGGAAQEAASDGKERFSESALVRLQNEKPEEYWSPAVQRRIQNGVVVRDL